MQKYYYIIPLLYILVVSILFANFIFESQKTQFTWGNIIANITTVSNEDKKTLKHAISLPNKPINISRINITLPYAHFSFNTHTNISSTFPESTLKSITPLPSGEGFVLRFANQFFISFQTNSLNPDEIAIIINSKSKQTIQIPLIVPFGIKAKLSKSSLMIIKPNRQSKIIASSQASFVKTQRNWLLVSRANYASFHFSNVSDKAPPIITKIPRLPPNTIENSRVVIKDFIDNTYAGWITKRFDRASGTWEQPEGFLGFTEETLVGAYAESQKRGLLNQYKIDLDKASVLHENSLSWKSAPYTRNGVDFLDSLIKDITDTQGLVLNEITNKNNKILEVFHVWNMLPLWNNEINKQTFLTFITKILPVNMPPEISAMLLFQSTKSNWQEFVNYINANIEIFEQNIVNNIVVINEGYLLLNSNKNIDILFSIVAGRYLSSSSSQESLQLLGHRILKTAISLANDSGVLPSIFVYNNNSFTSLGYIAPEIVYPIITDNPFYPTISKTNADTIYSFAATPLSIQQNDKTTKISIETPENGITQFLFLLSVEKPKSIFAFDVFWTGSKFNNNIVQGVSYNQQHKTIIIKTINRNSLEEIQLNY